MKKSSFYAALLLLTVGAPYASGYTVMTVKASQSNGEVAFKLTDELRFDFDLDKSELVVREGDDKSTTISFSNESTITFGSASGIFDVTATDGRSVALRQNPVESLLEFTSAPEAACTLRVYALQGQLLKSVNGWQGENVDVSTLAPGLYIVNFNNNSIKFYKK